MIFNKNGVTKLGGGWEGRQANRVFQTRIMYIWTSCLSMIKHRNLGTRQGKWCFNKVWNGPVSCTLHLLSQKKKEKKKGSIGPSVADQGIAGYRVWTAAEGGTGPERQISGGCVSHTEDTRIPQKQRARKSVAKGPVFKDRERRERLYLAAFVSSGCSNKIL